MLQVSSSQQRPWLAAILFWFAVLMAVPVFGLMAVPVFGLMAVQV